MYSERVSEISKGYVIFIIPILGSGICRDTIRLWYAHCTDKKDTKLFLIYKEIQMGSGAKSYMPNRLLLYG